MKLLRFVASGIHGFLNFDIKFNEDLTLLTGINGSGKTSALNAIVALLNPDLSILSSLDFNDIHLSINNNNNELEISAVKSENKVMLGVSSTKEVLGFNCYVADLDLVPSRQAEAEAEHYRDLLSATSDHPVIKAIASLPTPMFLGLDRRARFDDEIVRRARSPLGRIRRPLKNVFGTSLVRSLDDAADLAETRYRDTLIESGSITERLQRELLLDLLNVSIDEALPLSLPTPSKLKEIADLKKNLDPLATILRLPNQEVKEKVAPFLDLLVSYAEKLGPDRSIKEILDSSSDDNSEEVSSLFSWSSNQKHLNRINAISGTVKKYNSFRSALFSPVEKYLRLIEKFLGDGGKKIKFNERGYLNVEIEGVEGERSISSLSSGEAQIFVILTHLSFNQGAQKNVFIIDEPELSLHVQWQELFVESLQEANPKIQYIMATHSPSIILDRVKNCIDISRRR